MKLSVRCAYLLLIKDNVFSLKETNDSNSKSGGIH